MLSELLEDEEYREQLARSSYYRERAEDMARDAEHELEDGVEYFAMAWEDLTDDSKRPYRTTVAQTCDQLSSVVAQLA